MTLIYVGDDLLDLYPNTVVALTLKANDVGDLTTRNVNYTNNIKIPRTATNDRIFENAGVIESTSDIPYTKQTIKIVIDGVEVLKNGLINLTQVDTDYQFFITDNTADFFNQISNKPLTDVDLSDLNFQWSTADLGDYCDVTSGIIAPVINYGDFTEGSPSTMGQSLPAVYYHTLIDRIFSQAGYSYDGNVFSLTKYLNMILSFSRPKWEYAPTFIEDRKMSAIADGTQTMTGLTSTHVKIEFPETIIEDKAGYWDGLDEYTTSETGVSTDVVLFYADVLVTLDITVSGGATVNLFISYGAAFEVHLNNIGTGYYTLQSDTSNGMACYADRSIRVELNKNTGTPNVTINAASLIINPRKKIALSDTWVFFSYILPDITQAQFMQDFTVRFGLLFSEQADGTIIAKSLDEIIADKDSVPDWTTKRDISNPDQISFTPDGYAQHNYLRYDSADDYTDDKLGIGDIEVDNDILDSENDLFTSISANTNTSIFGDVLMARIPLFEDGDINDFDNDPGVRLLLVRDKYTNEPSITFDSAESSYKVAYFEDPDQEDTMSFTQDITDNYSLFNEALQQTKIVIRSYILTPIDVANFSFHKLIWDDGFFMVQEITNFIPGQPTKVKLLRVF